MKKYDDDDIRLLMKRESASGQLIAFALAAVYGFFAGAAALRLRDLAVNIALRLIYRADMEVNQYRGLANMTGIVSAAVLVGLWLITVLAAWSRIGKFDETKDRLRCCGIWCIGAAAAYGVCRIAELFL